MTPITGSIVALATPMHEDGSVDYPTLRKLIDWHIAEGTDCIGVVGTTGDPATPYWQAQNLANKILDNAQLVTFNGEGHTAYGRSNECVVKNIDAYLIDGIVPSSDPNC